MERALLTLLAAHPDRPVPADRLVDGLWGPTPPSTATKTLHTYVHRLRALLPAGTITTDGSGYRLAVPPGDIDAWRFAEEVTAAIDSVQLRPEDRADRLASALQQWRGTPFADVDAEPLLGPLRARLEDLHLQAMVARLDACVRAGRHREAVGELRAVLDQHPLREDVWANYALALYRSGRQADALGALATARRTLAEELGIEPGPELRRLQEQVLAQDPELQTGESPDEPAAGPDVEAASDEPLAQPEPEPERTADPERRLTTLLVAEVLGGQALRTAAGDDTARRVAAEVTAALSETMEEWQGTVIAADVWQMTAAFGVPVARDDDASRAIHAALALDASLADIRSQVDRSWTGGALRVRTAVHTASITVPLQAQDPAEMAATVPGLCAARPGTVLVSARTRTLTEELFEWGEEIASGQAWPVLAARHRPDKARLATGLRAPLIGRDADVAAVDAVLDALGNGVGGVLLITGEAGVGKSRLVSELADTHRDRMRWLVGHCASYAEATPYWPFRELLQSWLSLSQDPPDLETRVALHQQLERTVPDTAIELYPYLGAALGITLEPDQARRLQLAPEALQYRTFEAVGNLLEALARDDPVVLVIEDVHWADPTTVCLLEQLLDLTGTTALLLLITTRPDPDHPSTGISQTARRRLPHLTTELELTSLDGDGQRAMLEALIGPGTLPAAMARQVLELAEGNPFYLEELVGALVDAGALRSTRAGWTFDHEVQVSVPETVETVAHARIDRLDRPAHDLVTAASVLGRSFGLPLLQSVAGGRPGQPAGSGGSSGLVQTVNDLLRVGLLVQTQRWPESAYVFRHSLLQEAAYHLLPEERRRRLHRSAAEWLEDHYRGRRDEVAGLLARHWAAADDEDHAVTALLRAGDLARREHALDEAIDHYRRLLPLLERRGDTATTAIVLFRLALSLHNTLRFAEANRIYQRALAAWRPPAAVTATATLRYAGPPFRQVPDPVRPFTTCDIMLQMSLFDRLVERWPDDTIVPSLAEHWEISDDGLRYVFRLREGLVWSDGHPLTAGDVEFGIKRSLDPDRPGASAGLLYVFERAQDYVHRRLDDHRGIGVRALDDRTVEFRLATPAPYLMGMLNRPDCGPQPRHTIEARDDDWGAVEHEVVSGAFHRVSTTADRVVLERRADYQGHRAGNVRRVQWRLEEPPEATAAFRAGEVDLAWGAEPDAASRRSDASATSPLARVDYLVFQHAREPICDPRVRLALAHAIDRSALDALIQPRIAATGGLVPPALAGHTPDIAPRFDPARGRDLLGRACVDRPLHLAAPRSPTYGTAAMTEAVAGMWKEYLDLEVEVHLLDLAAYDELEEDPGTIDAFVSSWIPGYMDPDCFLRLLLHSEGPDNVGRFANTVYDDLVERARREVDGRTRLALYHQADRLAVAELAAVIPLAYRRIPFVHRPNLRGWWEFGKSWANFADLTLP